MTSESKGSEGTPKKEAPPKSESAARPDAQPARKIKAGEAVVASPLPDLAQAAKAASDAAAAMPLVAPVSIAADPLAAAQSNIDSAHFDVVMDIPVRMSVEVGRADISIRHVVQLGHGSLVELDRPATSPLDIRVNGILIARGEVVVVNDEKMGIRVTDIVSQAERLKRLR